ncbi:hypothetical protein FCV25MIE_16035 [Fagus crenata]
MKAYLARNHMKLEIVLMVMILLLTSAAARGGRGGGRSGGGHVTGGSQVGMGFFPSNWFSHTSHGNSHHKSNASALANPWSTTTIVSLMSYLALLCVI